jgi:hypothetical protein
VCGEVDQGRGIKGKDGKGKVKEMEREILKSKQDPMGRGSREDKHEVACYFSDLRLCLIRVQELTLHLTLSQDLDGFLLDLTTITSGNFYTTTHLLRIISYSHFITVTSNSKANILPPMPIRHRYNFASHIYTSFSHTAHPNTNNYTLFSNQSNNIRWFIKIQHTRV